MGGIRLTFFGIYYGVHLLLIKQNNGAVGFDAVWSGRDYRACGNALPMDALYYSYMSLNFCQTTRRHVIGECLQ